MRPDSEAEGRPLTYTPTHGPPSCDDQRFAEFNLVYLVDSHTIPGSCSLRWVCSSPMRLGPMDHRGEPMKNYFEVRTIAAPAACVCALVLAACQADSNMPGDPVDPCAAAPTVITRGHMQIPGLAA